MKKEDNSILSQEISNKTVVLWVIFLIGLLSFLYFSAKNNTEAQNKYQNYLGSGDNPSGIVSANQPESTKSITLQEFTQIQMGITYTDAVRIFGEDGTLVSSSVIGNSHIDIYDWKNFDGSNAALSFIDGKLSSKTQFNLK